MEHGALMAYSDDPVHRLRKVAEYVAKILSGTRPADLPVQQPTNSACSLASVQIEENRAQARFCRKIAVLQCTRLTLRTAEG